MSTKTTRIIGWVLTALVSAFMLFSAFMKIKGGPEMEANMKGSPLTMDTMRNIGFVEILCVLFWLIPRTGVIGMLLLCGYLGGAIYVHITMGMTDIFMPILLSAVVWIASALRMPELVSRLLGRMS